jgi:hypothetical protein
VLETLVHIWVTSIYGHTRLQNTSTSRKTLGPRCPRAGKP